MCVLMVGVIVMMMVIVGELMVGIILMVVVMIMDELMVGIVVMGVVIVRDDDDGYTSDGVDEWVN